MENLRTPKFYTPPKIDKQGNPRRSVAISINCPTSKISAYVEYLLQPLVKAIPSYVKGINNYFNKIKVTKEVPKETCLVTMDHFIQTSQTQKA